MVEPASTPATLTYDDLRSAVARSTAGVRLTVTLEPAGGPGDKVFPPTYEGGRYATERRRVGEVEMDAVLLDSVQSQANRMELALKAALDRAELALPVLAVDFSQPFPRI